MQPSQPDRAPAPPQFAVIVARPLPAGEPVFADARRIEPRTRPDQSSVNSARASSKSRRCPISSISVLPLFPFRINSCRAGTDVAPSTASTHRRGDKPWNEPSAWRCATKFRRASFRMLNSSGGGSSNVPLVRRRAAFGPKCGRPPSISATLSSPQLIGDRSRRRAVPGHQFGYASGASAIGSPSLRHLGMCSLRCSAPGFCRSAIRRRSSK